MLQAIAAARRLRRQERQARSAGDFCGQARPSRRRHDAFCSLSISASRWYQLIARRGCAEAGVYCERSCPSDKADKPRLPRINRRAIILSGGPASVTETHTPRAPQERVRDGRAGARHLLRRNDDVRAAGRVIRVEASHTCEIRRAEYSCPARRPRRCWKDLAENGAEPVSG